MAPLLVVGIAVGANVDVGVVPPGPDATVVGHS